MGYFSDAFGLSAGATLGDLAANKGFDAGIQLAARAFCVFCAATGGVAICSLQVFRSFYGTKNSL